MVSCRQPAHGFFGRLLTLYVCLQPTVCFRRLKIFEGRQFSLNCSVSTLFAPHLKSFGVVQLFVSIQSIPIRPFNPEMITITILNVLLRRAANTVRRDLLNCHCKWLQNVESMEISRMPLKPWMIHKNVYGVDIVGNNKETRLCYISATMLKEMPMN